VDLLIDNMSDYRAAMYEVARQVTELKILGEYRHQKSSVAVKKNI
jgi:predicted component of type VI protein secretion system